ATSDISILSLHDALPIYPSCLGPRSCLGGHRSRGPPASGPSSTLPAASNREFSLGVDLLDVDEVWHPGDHASDLGAVGQDVALRSEEHTSELQSRFDLVC